MKTEKADICLLLEGTYPYVAGGVSTWTHDLIQAQKDLSFHLLVLAPAGAELKAKYEIPENVVGITHITLQELVTGQLPRRETQVLLEQLGESLPAFLRHGNLEKLEEINGLLGGQRNTLGSEPLLNSRAAWDLLLKMYDSHLPDNSFLDYFWTWRSALSAFFSVMLCDLPKARVYHPVATGYAGLLAARAHAETGSPVLLTEHGIYTNERRIEIAMANWLYEIPKEGLSIDSSRLDLKQLWVDLFTSYSRTCYQACAEIVTLYEGNQILQLEEGADPDKLRIIPNGIDYARYSAVVRNEGPNPPTIALIGRVVPIKDVKTFIRACGILREAVPDLRALVMGPTDEDPDYYRECQETVGLLGLESCLEFTGKVRLEDYLGSIDAIALTSISEAQPLVILEAGAAGIPSVATDVGACREMILGRRSESPQLGPAGAVTPLSNPQETAEALAKLLTDKDWYVSCSEAIKQRVRCYYNKVDLDRTYHDLYRDLLSSNQAPKETVH
jgi:glycosyltransferase involved in cell wall biosynthesis